MSGYDDDLPDYLRGVDQQQGYPEPDAPAAGGGGALDGGFERYAAPPDPLGDDELTEEVARPSALGPAVMVVGGLTVVGGLLLLLGGFAVAMWASLIQTAESDALANGESLVEVVIAEKRIVDELGARGGNRAELEALLADVDGSSGLDRGIRALAYTNAVQDQIVQIGDLRNTPVQRRQHALDAAQDRFEASMTAWQTSAGNPLGQAAVGLGLANPPPIY